MKMNTTKLNLRSLGIPAGLTLAALVLAGCQSTQSGTTNQSQSGPAVAAPAVASTAPATPAAVKLPTIRIKAGASDGFKDHDGNPWLADQGFTDGDTTERPDITIANTPDQRIYQSERYSMTKFTQALPNGDYLVKLHFCETYDGITGPGQRVFSFNVAGHEFKDFDVWVKAGGPLRAYVETVPVTVTDGKLEISFTPNVENPQINGIEIIPAHD
jgi:hypothetical protein